MSGGHFNYMDATLKHEIFGYGDRFSNALEDREISELVWDVFQLLHDYDWYISGDTCRETYMEAKEEFRKKWFGKPDARVRRTIDIALEDLRRELYKTYGIQQEQTPD